MAAQAGVKRGSFFLIALLCCGLCACGRHEDIHDAVRAGSASSIKSFAAAGQINQLKPVRTGILITFEMSPLQAAAFWGKKKSIRQLILSGASADQADSVGQTALHVACGRYYFPDVPGKTYGITPDPEVVSLLLDLGANVNARDNFGVTPLMQAVSCAPVSVVRLLLQRGADPAIASNNQTAMLGAALDNKDPTVIMELIKHGAKLDEPNSVGATPLMLAAFLGRKDAMLILIKAGASLDAVDESGHNAADYAAGKAWPLKRYDDPYAREVIIKEINDAMARPGR